MGAKGTSPKNKRGIAMKISTEIHSASKILGEERAIAALAEAGFDAWDFSMFAMVRMMPTSSRPW